MVDDSQAKTAAHAVLAAVLQVRDSRLQALLWRRAREPFVEYWALPGGTRAVDEAAPRREGRRARGRASRAVGDAQRSGTQSDAARARDRVSGARAERGGP